MSQKNNEIPSIFEKAAEYLPREISDTNDEPDGRKAADNVLYLMNNANASIVDGILHKDGSFKIRVERFMPNVSQEVQLLISAFDAELYAEFERVLRELKDIQDYANTSNEVYFDITNAQLSSMYTLHNDKLESLALEAQRLVIALSAWFDAAQATTKSPSLLDACNSAGLLYRDMAVATYKDIIRFLKWSTKPRVWPF